jgi:bifunctional non-homologous end joining protein LigD
MLSAVRKQGLEGVIAKRKSSLYEAGKRTGSWAKMRLSRGQEFVVGGLIPGAHGVDSIIVGYHRDKDPVYVARIRSDISVSNTTRAFAPEELVRQARTVNF